MHLFQPGQPYFAGDCMPFFHAGTMHLVYLLDENHHHGLGGLGGHQWAHASTTDLIHWQHHPLALAIETDWEGSICTGSTFWHDGVFHAFYATRMPDWTQHLSHATSSDGIHFTKTTPNPFLSPPSGFGKFDFRDPFVFQDEGGRFHMLVTARIDPFPLYDRGGCLLRLSSSDLFQWAIEEPFLVPGGSPGYLNVPECSDYFYWNDWYYLLYSLGLKTVYHMSRQPFGPWSKPAVDLLDSPLNSVIKTSPIWDNRRLAVGFLGTREGNQDGGAVQWAGSVVFRELIQRPDGTLGTRFVPEMMPGHGEQIELRVEALTNGVAWQGRSVALAAGQSQEAAAVESVPLNFHFHCRVTPASPGGRFGLGLRGTGRYEKKVDLVFQPGIGRVTLAEQAIDGVTEIRAPFSIDLYFRDDIVEVCSQQSRCLINRLPDLQGERLFLFAEHTPVTFDEINIEAIF